MCFVMKRLLQEAGRKKPCREQDADSSPKMVTQSLRCTCTDDLALNRERVDVQLPALAASSSAHPGLLLTTVLEQLLGYLKSLASTSGKLI